jgi:hypothetical protein
MAVGVNSLFQDFVDWFNNEIGSELTDHVGLGLDAAFERHFKEERQKPGVRMSSMGKPALVTALQKLGYYEPEPKGHLRYIFFLGDVFENVLGVLLEAYGYKILADQTKHPEDTAVEWGGLKGHFDYLVEIDGKPVVVEAKTMSGNYARQFYKEPNDDRGYITQLALYSAATGHPAVWLCMDKSDGKMTEVLPDVPYMVDAVERAKEVLDRLDGMESLEDAFNLFRPPPARPEVFQRQETGKHLVPTSMSFSPYKSAVYKLSPAFNGYNKLTDYVYAYGDAEHAEEELKGLVARGELYRE